MQHGVIAMRERMSIHEIVLAETKPETEWILGRPVRKVSPVRTHGILQRTIATAVAAWAADRGDVGTEWRFRPAPAGEIRRPLVPDVAYVSDARLAPVMAGVLARRSVDALVFRGDDGLDELTTTSTSTVWVVSGGAVTEESFDPASLAYTHRLCGPGDGIVIVSVADLGLPLAVSV